MKLQIG